MRKELPKVYDPRQVEPRIYQMWMDGGCFKAEPNPDKKPFSIVMPPPNVTGQLHMGHAMDATLQGAPSANRPPPTYNGHSPPGCGNAISPVLHRPGAHRAPANGWFSRYAGYSGTTLPLRDRDGSP